MWQKFLPHIVDLTTFCNIPLQLDIGCFQFRDCLFQLLGHLIHTVSKFSDLIITCNRNLYVKIKFTHPFCSLGHPLDRCRENIAEQQHKGCSKYHKPDTDIDKQMRHNLHNRFDTCNRCTQQNLISIVQSSNQIIIIRIRYCIMVSSDDIFTRAKLTFVILTADAVHKTAHTLHHLTFVVDRCI